MTQQLWPTWEHDVLQALGAPDTAENFSFLDQWNVHELAVPPTHYNPFSTAYAGSAGEYGFGGVVNPGHQQYRIKDYPSGASGAKATAAEISSIAPNIASALKHGDILSESRSSQRAGISAELRHWGSTSFANQVLSGLPAMPSSSQLSTIAGEGGGSAAGKAKQIVQSQTQPSLPGADTLPGFSGVQGAVTGGVQHIPGVKQGEAAVHGISSIGDFFGWITDPHNLIRLGEIVGGFILIILGIYMLAKKSDTVPAMAAIAKGGSA